MGATSRVQLIGRLQRRIRWLKKLKTALDESFNDISKLDSSTDLLFTTRVDLHQAKDLVEKAIEGMQSVIANLRSNIGKAIRKGES